MGDMNIDLEPPNSNQETYYPENYDTNYWSTVCYLSLGFSLILSSMFSGRISMQSNSPVPYLLGIMQSLIQIRLYDSVIELPCGRY